MGKFADKGLTDLEDNKPSLSLASLMSKKTKPATAEETPAPEAIRKEKSVNTEIQKSVKPEPEVAKEAEVKMVKHTFNFSEGLTEQLEEFMYFSKPRIKNKHTVLRALLYDFLELPEEKRQIKFNAMLRKHKDLK